MTWHRGDPPPTEHFTADDVRDWHEWFVTTPFHGVSRCWLCVLIALIEALELG